MILRPPISPPLSSPESPPPAYAGPIHHPTDVGPETQSMEISQTPQAVAACDENPMMDSTRCDSPNVHDDLLDCKVVLVTQGTQTEGEESCSVSCQTDVSEDPSRDVDDAVTDAQGTEESDSMESQQIELQVPMPEAELNFDADVKLEVRSADTSTCSGSDFTEDVPMQTTSPETIFEEEKASPEKMHCASQTDQQGWMAPPQEVVDALRFANSILEQKTAQLEGKVNMLEATLTLKERQLVMEREDFSNRVAEVQQAMKAGLMQSVARIQELEGELANEKHANKKLSLCNQPTD